MSQNNGGTPCLKAVSNTRTLQKQNLGAGVKIAEEYKTERAK